MQSFKQSCWETLILHQTLYRPQLPTTYRDFLVITPVIKALLPGLARSKTRSRLASKTTKTPGDTERVTV